HSGFTGDGSSDVGAFELAGVIGLESDRNVDGLDRETDREIRERYYLSLAAGGASTIDSIRAAVLKTPGVRTARVVQNPTMEFDDEGRPPKSVEIGRASCRERGEIAGVGVA